MRPEFTGIEKRLHKLHERLSIVNPIRNKSRSGSILATARLTAETAEIAETKKNCMRVPSAFLCELGGEILSLIFRSNRSVFWTAAGLNPER
jgi:hypothetical protein